VGINDYVAGSLPWYLKVLASLAGFRGNRAQGIQEVRRVTVEGQWARVDAKLILAVLCRREKLYPETLQILQELAQAYPRNFLVQREIAGLYDIQGDLRSAARAYDSIVSKWERRERGYTEIPAAKILYEAGQSHARLGDLVTALARFERAGSLQANDIYVYRADLAAAELCQRLNRLPDALRKYRRVAEAVPNTDEGKAAQRALKRFPRSEPAKTVGTR